MTRHRIPDTVTITVEEYISLINHKRKLNALENAGVDNWEGYAYALDDFELVESFSDLTRSILLDKMENNND